MEHNVSLAGAMFNSHPYLDPRRGSPLLEFNASRQTWSHAQTDRRELTGPIGTPESLPREPIASPPVLPLDGSHPQTCGSNPWKPGFAGVQQPYASSEAYEGAPPSWHSWNGMPPPVIRNASWSSAGAAYAAAAAPYTAQYTVPAKYATPYGHPYGPHECGSPCDSHTSSSVSWGGNPLQQIQVVPDSYREDDYYPSISPSEPDAAAAAGSPYTYPSPVGLHAGFNAAEVAPNQPGLVEETCPADDDCAESTAVISVPSNSPPSPPRRELRHAPAARSPKARRTTTPGTSTKGIQKTAPPARQNRT